MKKLLLSLMILTSCTTAQKSLPRNIPNEGPYTADKISPVIRLKTDKDVFFCSGVIVSKNYAVTAAHCVNDMAGETIKLFDGDDKDTSVSAKVAAFSQSMDYALITGDFSGFNSAPLKDSMADIVTAAFNGQIVACGFPLGGKYACTQFLPEQPMYFGIYGQGILYPGMSGGPVVDTNTGYVIGVNSSMTNGGAVISPLVEIFKNFGVKND